MVYICLVHYETSKLRVGEWLSVKHFPCMCVMGGGRGRESERAREQE